jgi:hypothetical protein
MRYVPRAYVCSDADVGEVHELDNEGSQTFDEIYMRSPDDYRYVILERGDTFTAVDLWRAPISESLEIVMGPSKTYRTLDAAIMGCVLTQQNAMAE